MLYATYARGYSVPLGYTGVKRISLLLASLLLVATLLLCFLLPLYQQLGPSAELYAPPQPSNNLTVVVLAMLWPTVPLGMLSASVNVPTLLITSILFTVSDTSASIR
jgi:hypothetical protein